MANPKLQKKPAADWHPADIVAALRKTGWSMTQLALHYGYASKALSLAIQRPYPKAERIIAETLGVAPQVIWPSRYDEHGVPNRPRGRPIRPTNVQPVRNATPVRASRDMQTAKAA